jgi:hypothetical protein
VLVGVLGHAANTIATHPGLGAVGIEHPHPHIRFFRWANQYQPVSPDPFMPVAYHYCQFRRIAYLLVEAVDIYIIIAKTMHFRKLHKEIQN